MRRLVPGIVVLLAMVGCVTHKHTQPQVIRFTRCARNGEAIVCECEHIHDVVNAKTKEKVRVCD